MSAPFQHPVFLDLKARAELQWRFNEVPPLGRLTAWWGLLLVNGNAIKNKNDNLALGRLLARDLTLVRGTRSRPLGVLLSLPPALLHPTQPSVLQHRK